MFDSEKKAKKYVIAISCRKVPFQFTNLRHVSASAKSEWMLALSDIRKIFVNARNLANSFPITSCKVIIMMIKSWTKRKCCL